jgi:HxlR-like helix-turn-helix
MCPRTAAPSARRLHVSATNGRTLLGDGSKRFNELRRGLGSISQRMLTLTLKGLERDGLVTRSVFPTIPPRVDYELTKLGQFLARTRQPSWPVGQAEPRRYPGSKTPVRCCQSWGLKPYGLVQIANANDRLEARASSAGSLLILSKTARCRSRGPPPRAILLIQTRRGTINLAVRRCTTSFR